MTDQAVLDWREAGKHLPPMLRDFHDQKDVFKVVHTMCAPESGDVHGIRYPSWVEAQCYVIDSFLWVMARHGYTLQRSRSGLPFDSLHDNIKAMKEREAALFAHLLEGQRAKGDGDA